MPSDVLEVTKKFMRDPIRILVKEGRVDTGGYPSILHQCGAERWGPVQEAGLVVSCWV